MRFRASQEGHIMASLMFRAALDNPWHSEASKPKGRGTWYVFYYDHPGKKMRLRVGPNKRTAELAKGDIEARLAKQRVGLLDPDREVRQITIASFREQLPGYLQTENKAPKTVSRYCGVFALFCSFLEAQEAHVRYLDQIDGPMLERYKDFLRRQRITPNGHPHTKARDGVSVRTLNNELAFLTTIVNLAKRRGYLRTNPVKKVRKINAESRKHYEPLSRAQIDALLDAADSGFRPILLTFLLTGLRTGELLALEWNDTT